MVEKEAQNAIEELEGLSEEIEEIEQHPILKPLLEYNKTANMLAKEDESESEYLNKKIKDLDDLLETGIYEDSSIAQRYKSVTEVYQRLLLIMSRYTDLADKKIVEIKKLVEKYYISKKEHEENIFEIKQDYEKDLNKIKERINKEELIKKTKSKKESPTQEELKEEEEEMQEFLEENLGGN